MWFLINHIKNLKKFQIHNGYLSETAISSAMVCNSVNGVNGVMEQQCKYVDSIIHFSLSAKMY